MFLSEAYSEEDAYHASSEVFAYLENKKYDLLPKPMLESFLYFFFIFRDKIVNQLAVFYALLFNDSFSFHKKDRVFDIFPGFVLKQIKYLHEFDNFYENDFGLLSKDFEIYTDILKYHRPFIIGTNRVFLCEDSPLGISLVPLSKNSPLTKEMLKECLIQLAKKANQITTPLIRKQYTDTIVRLSKNFNSLRIS